MAPIRDPEAICRLRVSSVWNRKQVNSLTRSGLRRAWIISGGQLWLSLTYRSAKHDEVVGVAKQGD